MVGQGGRLPDGIVRSIMRNRGVRRRLEDVGRRVAARAQQITNDEGGSANIELVLGIRPGGRSYVNVTNDRPDEEHGTENTPRIRAVGRAAREGL